MNPIAPVTGPRDQALQEKETLATLRIPVPDVKSVRCIPATPHTCCGVSWAAMACLFYSPACDNETPHTRLVCFVMLNETLGILRLLCIQYRFLVWDLIFFA